MLWSYYGWGQSYGKLIKNALSPAKVQKGKTVTRRYSNKSKFRGEGRPAPGVSGPIPPIPLPMGSSGQFNCGRVPGNRINPGAYSLDDREAQISLQNDQERPMDRCCGCAIRPRIPRRRFRDGGRGAALDFDQIERLVPSYG
jgi:hypothetical protein